MWTCDRCGKVFQRRLHVAQHRRTHSVFRPYKCQFGHCLQSFPILNQLQRHQRTHIDHRRYHCPICRTRFLRQRHLDHHKCQPKHRHVYKCHVCSATFLRILSLANHVYEQHHRVVRARRLQCQQSLNGNQKKTRYKGPDTENGDDSKILLKITLGKSMTIISPSKNSPNASESKKKSQKKKAKKKHRKGEKRQEKKGIILSIKKGMVNVTDKRNTDSKLKQVVSKTKQQEKMNGFVNTEYKLGEQKSELRLTIKACPDLTVSPIKGDTYKVLEKSDSRSSLKLEKRTSSRTDIDSMENLGSQSPLASKDDAESKVRNGIVITKDKTGKLLAEQLPAVKLKKRDNVFDDIGIWKVMASPRDRPNDILKLKLSPQKPARIESTLEDACAYNASKYLDIPVNSGKVKGEVSGEDSDILELLPAYDKESDSGINNVNDSGIEVLSSSSCNRSNGNSVRSVVMEDNSPTYFNTEDSLLSLDSPLTEVLSKTEHSICHKCGGVIMETNNNTRSPGKCRCTVSNPHSPFEMPISPVKTNLLSSEASEALATVSSEHQTNISKLECNSDKDNVNEDKIEKENVDQEKSDEEDSDVMIITFDKNQNSPELGKSRLKLKLRPKDQSKSIANGENEVLPSSAKRKLNQPVSPWKHDKSKSAENIKTESATVKNDINTDIKDVLDNENQHKDNIEILNSSLDGNNSKRNETNEIANVHFVKHEAKPMESPVIEENEISVTSDNSVSNSPMSNEQGKQSRKKPLFKSKKCATKDSTNLSSSLKLNDDLKQSKEGKYVASDEKPVQNKKPLFKKRALSVDENSERNAKKSCKTQMSVPAQSTADSMLDGAIDRNENTAQQADRIDIDKLKTSPKDSALDSKVQENITVETDNIPTKTPVSKLRTIGFDEEDSLLDLSTDIIEEERVSKHVEKSQKPPVSFDLYQQQFLSFISSTMSGSRLDKKKLEENSETMTKDKMEIEKELAINDIVEEVSIGEVNTNDKEEVVKRKPKRRDLRNKKDDKCRIYEIKSKSDINDKICEIDSKADSTDKTENEVDSDKDLVEIKSNKVCKKIKKKRLSKSKISFEKKTINPSSEKLVKDAKVEIEKKVMIHEKEIEKCDSLSWLTIFGDSASKGKSQKTDTDTALDVMTDLSENLAEINKKIDVSEDDDSNSLDVDDVFQVKTLSSLQPKHEINFSMSQAKICAKEKSVKCEKIVNSPPYRRRQTAKRTVGKFKSAKRKIEDKDSEESSDTETIDILSSHQGSDPDFNPFNDSDDDFVKAPRKRRQSRTCSAKRRTCNGSESSDSDDESKCSEVDKLETESQSSRSRRTKKGRKSCCPCCIGSPRKRFSVHREDQLSVSETEAYKLPRKHKQFVKSTLKLLQLQEKIHTLFLTLFPECTEMINHSNIGTEEFESLIDDVLSGLEEKEVQCCSLPHSVTYMKKDVESQFEPCPVSNIEMPFAASGLATRTSEIDLVTTSGDDRSPTNASIVQTVNHKSYSHVDLGTSSVQMEENNYEHNTAGKEFEAGMIWQHSSLFNQTSLAASTASSTKLKFENNTLTDNDEPMEESTFENVLSHPSTVHASSLAYSQESLAVPMTSSHSAVSQVDLMNINSIPHDNVLDHSEPFDNVEYYAPEVDSDQGVHSEITITLDLNAARVSLCRSPKNCLQRLQSQIIKLTKCFFPKLYFKNYFYRNIDNLEFLLDLMIEANSKEIPGDLESENEILEEGDIEKWYHEPSNNIDIVETPIIKEDDTVKVNFFGLKSDVKTEEREPLFVKCSELFEQEIKSQRESLKKDMFIVEEDKTEDTWKKAEEVLHSISSLKKIARETEMAQRTRRPRDCRLRKRSADEKRTLFVQEKLQNSQNSTFVCDTSTKTKAKGKAGRKPRPVSSKKRFLSGLNLGDKLVNHETEIENLLDNKPIEDSQNDVLTKENDIENKTKFKPTNILEEKVSLSDQIVENNLKGKHETIESLEDTDCSVKAGVKNIFELMQPS